MLADTLIQGSDVLSSRNCNRHQPTGGKEQHDPTNLTCRHMQGGGENKNCQARQAVTQAPDHGVYEPFDLYLDPGREWKVEQFDGGLRSEERRVGKEWRY